MTGRAVQIGVARKFVSEGGGRIAFAPRQQRDPVVYFHRRGDLRVEIRFRQRRGGFVTRRAVGRRGQNSGVRRMTRKTARVPDRRSFKSSFFEPERVAQFGGRLCQKFVFGRALRFICLMADRAALAFLRGGAFETRVDEQRAVQGFFGLADDPDVFVVRKRDLKIRGGGGFAFRRQIENFARVRKRMTRCALRRRSGVTDRADRRSRSFKELLAMTAQTGFVARIIGDVGKRVRFSDGFPVF